MNQAWTWAFVISEGLGFEKALPCLCPQQDGNWAIERKLLGLEAGAGVGVGDRTHTSLGGRTIRVHVLYMGTLRIREVKKLAQGLLGECERTGAYTPDLESTWPHSLRLALRTGPATWWLCDSGHVASPL